MRRDLRTTAAHAARVVLLSYLAAACSASIYRSTASLPAAGSSPIPRARVHLSGNSQVYTLSDVIMDADSLVGFDVPTGKRVAIPQASVTLVETNRVDPVRTVGLIGGILLGSALVLAAVLAYAVGHSTWD